MNLNIKSLRHRTMLNGWFKMPKGVQIQNLRSSTESTSFRSACYHSRTYKTRNTHVKKNPDVGCNNLYVYR